ncbi:Na+/H+ antiporter subunit A [Salinibacterium sp. G-O1]|uniref:Na+/H+ antiporter subunit A n=1 Tax=Salinibacterium sp. G-O1 TaxID=3046208 RepID=UPI0024B87E3E|nr:Na+/H+ antiporter subunit A [Salinibacterium sp. G-O1]MDJ0335867.1 Na+/H+ antiporter subunit A [Salinibacterium sp. G-O1]
MLAILLAFAVGSLVMPLFTRQFGRNAFFIAAIVPTAAFVAALVEGPRILAGEAIVQSASWVDELAMSVSVRMDTLSWLLTLVVTGVGALVLIYCARYFRSDEDSLGRFAALLLAFAGAMYGLVLADDVYLLFIFWEATSVLSYLLIGHYTGKKTSRSAALQALLVTTFGGLVMFVGLVLLAVETGTSSLSAIIAAAPSDTLAVVAIMLVLVGALSKSAIFPFHFWLPAAMAAPTPVSAYLHAAAMVKAGIYLVARLAPGFAEIDGWHEVIIGLGVITMVLGGWNALKQHDLKLVLAYGTVSQLGFMLIVVGYGTRDAALAGAALLLAHALFKSTLFLAVGIIDHRAGTRDLRKLSGLGREAPVLAVITAAAIASMVGLPPTLGFVAKEAVFTALLADATAGSLFGWVALVGVALGSVLTVAYSARFLWGAFSRKPGVEACRSVNEHVDFLLAPALLATSGLALGLMASLVDGWLSGYSMAFPAGEESYHLALWHGLEPALAISALTLASGGVLFMARQRVAHIQKALGTGLSAAAAYNRSIRFIDRTAARTTSLTQRGSLPFYLGVILTVFTVTIGTTLMLNRTWTGELRLWDYPAQLAIAAVMIVAAVAATRAGKRFQAVVLVGVTGIGMSALFALQGAPDLALTQILVEVVTLVAFMLVLRRLPARLGHQHGTAHKGIRAVIGGSVGLLMAVVAVVALGARTELPISLEWAQLAFEEGHGRNIVNVALVDLRGWDTMGELSVIIAAATGVASLIFISGRGVDNLPTVARREAKKTARARLRRSSDPTTTDRGSWLLAGRTLADRNRSILLEVVVRLIFHPVIVVSLYLLLAGHNAPGGGFAGGLVAGMALVARYLAGGRHELGAAAPVDAGKLLGVGLVLAVGTAMVPLIFGADALTSSYFEWELGIFGELTFVTSTIFDIGVYLVVIGLVLDVLRSLGAEVDRQYEEDGVHENPVEKVASGERRATS